MTSEQDTVWFTKNESVLFLRFFKMAEFAMKQFKGVAELFVNLDITAVPNEIRNDIIQRALK